MFPRGIARQIVLGYVLPLIVLLVAGLLIPVFLWGFAGRYRGEFAAHKELASRADVLLHAAEDVAEAERSLKRFKDPEFRQAQNQARRIYQERYQEIMSWFDDHSNPGRREAFERANREFQSWDRKGFRDDAKFVPIDNALTQLYRDAVQDRDRYEPLYLIADTLRNIALIVFPLGALVSALFIGRSIARTITEPLAALAVAVERLERGDEPVGEVPEQGKRDDELGELWHALYRMAATVQERERALEARSEALATTGRRLESVLNATNDGIALLSHTGEFLLVNPRFAELFGHDKEAIEGHRFSRIGPRLLSLLKRSEQASARARLRELMGDLERVVTETFALARPFPRILRLFSAPVRSEGALIGRIIVLRDVTAETEADRLKSEFASTVSHELRTPLTAIHGNVALLLSERPGALTDNQREFLQLTQTSVQRLTGLITEILDLSRLESSGLQMERKPLACGELARLAVRTMEEQARAKGIELTLHLPESLPEVLGDSARVSQVLMNLISNALKYTHSGGKVIVRLSANEAQLTVRVSDTGIGIAPEDRGRLFGKFFRADNSTTRSVGGTGLGLAISKAIVEGLGGTIWVESTPGIGSTFSFTLPLQQQTAVEEPGPLTVQGSPRRLILLAHDQTTVLHRLNHSLSQQGMIVSAAAIPAEAVRRARDLRPDALLLPPFTTAFDAFQLIRSLRSDPATERTLVILYALRGVGMTYELRDTIALTSVERLSGTLTTLKLDEGARNRPVVVIGDEVLLQTVRALWGRQELSPIVWCRTAEELVGKVGPLCPLVTLCDTATQDMRTLGSFARASLERHPTQRVAWVFIGEFGNRTRVLIPQGSGAVPLEHGTSYLHEAITAAL